MLWCFYSFSAAASLALFCEYYKAPLNLMTYRNVALPRSIWFCTANSLLMRRFRHTCKLRRPLDLYDPLNKPLYQIPGLDHFNLTTAIDYTIPNRAPFHSFRHISGILPPENHITVDLTSFTANGEWQPVFHSPMPKHALRTVHGQWTPEDNTRTSPSPKFVSESLILTSFATLVPIYPSWLSSPQEESAILKFKDKVEGIGRVRAKRMFWCGQRVSDTVWPTCKLVRRCLTIASKGKMRGAKWGREWLMRWWCRWLFRGDRWRVMGD